MIQSIILLPLTLAFSAQALTIPFRTNKFRRDDSDDFNFQNFNNGSNLADVYVATLTVAGKDLTVRPLIVTVISAEIIHSQAQIDTGSSDLWFDTTGVDLSSGLLDSKLNATITYL